MNINVYERYKVKCKGEYSYNTPSYECENDWHTEKVKWQKTLEGGEIMEMIATGLKDKVCGEFRVEKNSVYLCFFDPNNGECGYYIYTIDKHH